MVKSSQNFNRKRNKIYAFCQLLNFTTSLLQFFVTIFQEELSLCSHIFGAFCNRLLVAVFGNPASFCFTIVTAPVILPFQGLFLNTLTVVLHITFFYSDIWGMKCFSLALNLDFGRENVWRSFESNMYSSFVTFPSTIISFLKTPIHFILV